MNNCIIRVFELLFAIIRSECWIWIRLINLSDFPSFFIREPLALKVRHKAKGSINLTLITLSAIQYDFFGTNFPKKYDLWVKLQAEIIFKSSKTFRSPQNYHKNIILIWKDSLKTKLLHDIIKKVLLFSYWRRNEKNWSKSENPTHFETYQMLINKCLSKKTNNNFLNIISILSIINLEC